MASDAHGEAVKALKKKLKEQAFKQAYADSPKSGMGGIEPLAVLVDEVALAVKGKSDPDWDPKEHPKDAEGKFTEKHSATFTGGKFKTANYLDKYGIAQLVFLGPGEKLHKLQSGNHFIEHADGSVTYADYSVYNKGHQLTPNSTGVKTIQNPNVSSLVAENPVEPSQAPESSHPNVHQGLHNPYFNHPVSAETAELMPGQTLMQHKKSPNSFLLINEDQETGFFFNKHGQKITSNPSTKVWTPKNYTQIWPPSETSATPAKEATAILQKKLAEETKTEVKAKAVDELAPWEKELLAVGQTVVQLPAGSVTLDSGDEVWKQQSGDVYLLLKSNPPQVYWQEVNGSLTLMGDAPAAIKQSPNFVPFAVHGQQKTEVADPAKFKLSPTLSVNLGPGDALFENVNGSSFIWLKGKDQEILYGVPGNSAWKAGFVTHSWWAKSSSNYKQIGGDVPDNPSPLITHEEDDGPWGSVKSPSEGKIKLFPGETVFYSTDSFFPQVVVLTLPEGSGVVYTKTGLNSFVNSQEFYETSSSWKKLTEVSLEPVDFAQGKPLGADSVQDIQDQLDSVVPQLAKDLSVTTKYGSSWAFVGITNQQKFMALLQNPKMRTRAANLAATIRESGAKSFQSDLRALEITVQASELAELLTSGSSNVKDVENRWATLKQSVFKDYGGQHVFALPTIAARLNSEMISWRFTQAQEAKLGFNLATASEAQLQQFMVSQGFVGASFVSKENALKWAKAYLGDPMISGKSSVMKDISGQANVKAVSVQAELALKKLLAKPEPKSVSESDSAVLAQSAAYQSMLKKLPQSYKFSGDSTESHAFYYQSPDVWSEYENGSFQGQVTTKTVLDTVASNSAWTPEGPTIEGESSLAAHLELWNQQNFGVSLEDANKTALNTYIKANGGNYVALMKGSHKQEWIKFHLAKDEIAKWTLEHKLAFGTYKLHKWEGTHPGAWGSAQGKAARQATADFLQTQEWFKPLADQLGKDEPDWYGVQSLPNEDINDAFTILALDSQYGKSNGTAERRKAVQWWLESRGRLPVANLQQKSVEKLVEPSTAEAPVPPVGVDQTAWNLLLAAEQDLPDIQKLPTDHSLSFSALGFGLDPSLEYPAGVQHLLRWSAFADNDSDQMMNIKNSVRAAALARAKSGVWNPPGVLLWQDSTGAEHPLKPGWTLHQHPEFSSYFAVISPDKKTGYSFDGAYLSPITHSSLKKVLEYPTKLKAPQPLTYAAAKSDKLDVSAFTWDSVEEIEQKSAGEVKFPGLPSLPNDNGQLAKVLSFAPSAPPYTKANADKLPLQVQLMAVWALGEGNKPVLDTIEYKLKNGHYAELQLGKLLDPSASYYQSLMKSDFSADQIWSEWTATQTSELGIALGIETPDFWSKQHTEDLYKAVTQTLHPSPLTLGEGPELSSAGLPQELHLTQVDKSLGGMHTKQVWQDQLGNEWMSKAFKNDENAGARIDAEHIANVIGRLFGSHSPETRTMELYGQYQYVQHLKDAKGDLSGMSWDNLNEEQLSQTMSEHVMDWLNSNHDSHPMNLLKDPNGKDIIPIDKGQAWRFFGEDKLATGYLPPSNPIAVWYDQFYYAVEGGQVDKAQLDKVTRRVLTKAYQASSKHDDTVRGLLEQAFDKRVNFPANFSNKQQLIDGVMARKAALLTDFEAFYKKLYSAGGYTWDVDVEQLKKSKLDDHTHVSVTDEFAQDVLKAGVHGKALMFDTEDLEDAHLIVYTEKKGSSTSLAGQGFVRQKADKKVTKWLKSQLVENETDPVENSYSTDYETSQDFADLPNNSHWYSYLVSAAKTVNHHVEDKEFNQGTLDAMASIKASLTTQLDSLYDWEFKYPEKPYEGDSIKLVTAEQQAAWKGMMRRYLEDIARIEKAKEDGVKVSPHVQQANYVPSVNLNVTGTPKVVLTLVNEEGSLLSIWDDVNYVLTKDGSKTKLQVNQYKAQIEKGGWVPQKSTQAAAAAENAGGEVWTQTKASGVYTWTKKVGATEWTSGDGSLISDSTLQGAIGAEPQQWSFKGPEVDVQTEVKIGEKTFKVFKRKSHATQGSFDYQTGELKATGKLQADYYSEESQGQTGYQYDIEYNDVTVHYRPWTEPGVALSQQGMLKFKVENWNGSTDQMNDVIDTLRTVGLDMSEADEESLQLFYWRHLYAILQERSDVSSSKWSKITESFKNSLAAKPKMSATEELEALKKAWATSIGSPAVETADWMPKFSRFNPHVTKDSPDFTAGHPHWLRPDATIKDVREAYGETMAQSSVGHHHKMDEIVLSGGMLSTEERIRVLGQWISGMSSSADQPKGSAGFVFSRQNQESENAQVYYHPKVSLRTSNYAFNTDHYGDIKQRSGSAYFDLGTSLTHSYGNNELMIKHGLSFLDDIAVVRFSTAAQREKVLKRYKELGITKIHGLPIEEVLVTSVPQADAAMKKVWQTALKEAQ